MSDISLTKQTDVQEIKFTKDDFPAALSAIQDDRKVDAIKELVDYYRYRQKEFGNGVEELTYLIHTGKMELTLYLSIRQAVENPTTPYEVVLIK